MTTTEIKHLLKTDSKATVKAAKYVATYYVAALLGKNETKYKFGGVVNVREKRLVVGIMQNITKYNSQPTFKQLNILKEFLYSYEPIHWLLIDVINGVLPKEVYPISDSELLAFNAEYLTDYHKTH